MAISKKSTIFAQSSWNLVKITTSWLGNIDWIWAQLDQNYGFFTSSQLFGLSNFLLPILYESSGALRAQGKILDKLASNWSKMGTFQESVVTVLAPLTQTLVQ